MMSKEDLLKAFAGYAPHADSAFLAKAYEFAVQAHGNQSRASGEHYFGHCEAVAEMLLEWKMDLPTVAAGLLHDVLEDTPVTPEELSAQFGPEVTRLVQGVTKIATLKFPSRVDAQAENWRRMLLATAEDIRVILIKLADRLHNMRTINFLDYERQRRIAEETMYLYAPLAHRLGMFEIKGQLEDLAFEVIDNRSYRQISGEMQSRMAAREELLKSFQAKIEEVLKPSGLPCRLLSRTKSLYSIFQKMHRQGKPLSEIQDALGVRLITDSVANCYALLGLVHAHFKPAAGTFTDYISLPKVNLYQSLHTTVVGPGGEPIEIQIRTEEMHRTAEYGIAAHWRYKGGGGANDPHLEEKLNWLRQWIEWLQDLKNPREFLESLKTDLDFNQVFVFTPQGEVKVLPAGATPLDFAFAVHSEIGSACVGALVNNKMVKLDYEFKSGDICHILTKSGSVPKKDWLSHVKTARARSKIRRYFREKGIAL